MRGALSLGRVAQPTPFPACRLLNACRARVREVVGPNILGIALGDVAGFPGGPVDSVKARFASALAFMPVSDSTAQQYEVIMKAVNSSIDLKNSADAVGLVGRKLYIDIFKLRNPCVWVWTRYASLMRAYAISNHSDSSPPRSPHQKEAHL